MRALRVTTPSALVDFDAALAEARRLAGAALGEPMLLSWYDARRALESPRGVSECSAAAPTAGVLAYAGSRGGALAVECHAADGLAYLFCFADCVDFSGSPDLAASAGG